MALFGKVKGARAFWHGEAPETPEMVAKIEQAVEDLRLKLFVVWAEDYEAARQPWEVEAPNPRAAVEYWKAQADMPNGIDWEDTDIPYVDVLVENLTTKERWSVTITAVVEVEWEIETPDLLPTSVDVARG